MSRFIAAHATHPDAHMALALAAAQIEAQRSARDTSRTPGHAPDHAPTLGLVYLTDHCAAQSEALLDDLRQRWPGVSWSGCVGVGVMGSGVEYYDEPALALMLTDLPAPQFQLFNGRQPLDGRVADSALVHVDPHTHDLPELLAELSDRTASGYLFGGLASSRGRTLHVSDAIFEGGLSGVAFGPQVALTSRVTQGCQPVGPTRHVTACDGNLVLELDGRPALGALLSDLGVTLDQPQRALAAMRRTLAGLTDGRDVALSRGGQFGTDTLVRHIIGIDPARDAVAVAEQLEPGQQLAFCRRDVDAARRDLVRICTEIREDVEAGATHIAGAVYVSCTGRGGPHFGGASAEALIVQHALGDVPLVGFFAAGEVAHHHLYGYTGVLTVFTTP
jgi:small ligand-binding sensory domain FIST